jgi:uncharacterized protein (TIGR03083 family)
MADIWTRIREERQALADLLPTLSNEQWETPSLCDGWSVRDVVAHLISVHERETWPTFFAILQNRLSVDRYNANSMRRIGAVSDKTLIARYDTTVEMQTKPFIPTQFVLAESLIHNEDIFKALDSERVVPIETVLLIAQLYRSIGMARKWKRKSAHIKLVATDADWTYGNGDEARGPLLSIVMLLAGRNVVSRDLEGAGAERLQRRAFASS